MHIAVASGHKRSTTLLFEGNSLLRVLTGPTLGIHHMAPRTFHMRLAKLLNNCSSTLGLSVENLVGQLSRLAISLPGLSLKCDHDEAFDALSESGWAIDSESVYLCDDTQAGLFAGLNAMSGICAFAGVGASVLHLPDETAPASPPFKRDGLGPYLGDRGSKFDLGKSTIRELGRALDSCNHSLSRFQESVIKCILSLAKEEDSAKEHLHQRRLQRAVDFILSRSIAKQTDSMCQIADITIHFSSFDKDAKKLVRQLARELSETFATIFSNDTFAQQARRLKVTCQGELFRESSIYLSAFQEFLQPYTAQSIEIAKYRPVFGLGLLLMTDNWSIPDADSIVTCNFVKQIDELPARDANRIRNSHIPIKLPTQMDGTFL